MRYGAGGLTALVCDLELQLADIVPEDVAGLSIEDEISSERVT